VLDPLFSLRALTGYSSIGYSTLQRLLPRIPHFRVGGKILVRRSEFDRWLEQYREQIGVSVPSADRNSALRAARARRAVGG
jgi:excisionase family DNA binding protein